MIAVMTHGSDLPTEISLHNERHRNFVQAAQYALSEEEIYTVLAHKDAGEKRTYYHNLLITSTSALTALLYNDARQYFQKQVFASITMRSTNCTWGWDRPKACLISK
jgi:hypothetical protein